MIAGVAVCPYPDPSVGEVTRLIVWLGHDPLIAILLPATSAGDGVPVPPLAMGSIPVMAPALLAIRPDVPWPMSTEFTGNDVCPVPPSCTVTGNVKPP